MTVGDWRAETTASSGLLRRLGHEETAGAYVFSARCCGLKGLAPGARHTWLSVHHDGMWRTYELTDVATLSLQVTPGGSAASWKCLGPTGLDEDQNAPFRSNRAPDALWFGSPPRLESMAFGQRFARTISRDLDRFCHEYPFSSSYSLLDNNCSKLISYLVWQVSRATGQQDVLKPLFKPLIGFRSSAYWTLHERSLADRRHQSRDRATTPNHLETI